MRPWHHVLPALVTLVYLAGVAALGWRTGRSWTVAGAGLAGAVVGPLLASVLAKVVGVAWDNWTGFVHVWLSGAPLWSGAVEEAAKAAAVFGLYAGFRQGFQTGLDEALHGLAVGAGYAFAGHVGTLLTPSALLRTVGAELHAFSSGLTLAILLALYGGSVGAAVERQGQGALRRVVLWGGWLVGVGGGAAFLGLARASQAQGPWHSLATAGLFLWEWSPVAILALLHLWTARREREVLVRFLREEAGTDVVTQDEFLALLVDARGFPKRLRAALLRLAWAKWQVVHGLAPEAEVEVWRDRVRELRRAS